MKNELEALARKLSPNQLSFCKEYIKRASDVASGSLPLYRIYMNNYPKCKSQRTAESASSRFMNPGSNARMYIDLAITATGAPGNADDTIMSVEESRRDLTAMARADMTEFVSWDIIEGPNGERIPAPKLADFENVPKAQRKLIKAVTFTKNGPKFELHDQQKAYDMLNRMNGAYIEKKEISGPGGGPILSAVANVSPEELKELARGLLDKL